MHLSSYIRSFVATVVVITGLFAGEAIAQPGAGTDEQLAAHYFQNGEFDKAALYYEKLYDKKPTDFYYQYYLKSLVQLEDYKSGEKLVKKQIKRNPAELKYLVDLGSLYDKLNEENKARQQYDKAIKKLNPNRNQIINLAKAFIGISKNDLALETYQKGQKLMRGDYPFTFEIAELYGTMGDFDSMISEYLALLENNSGYVQSVQNSLARVMVFDEQNAQTEELRVQLLKRVQKNPNNEVFAEMLIWLFLQQKDFNSAFIQTKALDKRMNEDGQRLMSLAKLCANNREYKVANKAYQTVIDKGPENYYYMKARMEQLDVMHEKVTTGRYAQEEIVELEANYRTTVDELGKRPETIGLMRQWAQLNAYYLNNPDLAVEILEMALKVYRIRPKDAGLVKLDLGDVLVIQNNIWDASLYYGQVDKAFKYDELGEQAKFRNARIYYYTGQFEFARGMLDVLKGSTAKLIANDALHLSLLITDNTGLDTSTTAMLMFARAELLIVQHQFDKALVTLDSINTVFPGHSLADEILMKRYEIDFGLRDYEQSAAHLQAIIDNHSYDLLADDAIYKLAQLNEYYLENSDAARDLYQQLLLDHPGSLYVVEARKRFRELRGDKLN